MVGGLQVVCRRVGAGRLLDVTWSAHQTSFSAPVDGVLLVPPLRALVFGDRFERSFVLLSAVVLFLGTFVAYATGLFAVADGVIVPPLDATVVGFFVAAAVGYRRGALLGGWVSPFAAYLGFNADWAFLGLSSHSLIGKLAFFFDPMRLGVFAVASLVGGSVACGLGYLVSVMIVYAKTARWRDSDSPPNSRARNIFHGHVRCDGHGPRNRCSIHRQHA